MSDAAPTPAPATAGGGSRRRLRGWRGWLARFVLLGMVGVFCLLAMEFLVRLFLPYYNPRNQILIRRDENGVALGIPNMRTVQGTPKGDFLMEVVFNSRGFRDPKDFVQARPEDVIVVGDSFSIGWGVAEAERYSNVLERDWGRPVYNVAIPEDIRGYRRTVDLLRRHGVRPGHVILGLCMENDLWDYDTVVDTHQVYRQQMYRTWRHKFASWFKANSALWTAMSHTLQRHESIRRVFEKAGIARNIDELTHKNDPTPQVIDSSVRQLLGIVTNQPTVVLVIPSRALWYGKNTEKEKRAHEEVVGRLRSAGVALVDMKPRFEQAGDPLAFYFKSDPHWNARGHALAAQALREFLEQAPGWEFLRRPARPGGDPAAAVPR